MGGWVGGWMGIRVEGGRGIVKWIGEKTQSGVG
jgi:hypothetical protein